MLSRDRSSCEVAEQTEGVHLGELQPDRRIVDERLAETRWVGPWLPRATLTAHQANAV
jgi:hypothetical protein